MRHARWAIVWMLLPLTACPASRSANGPTTTPATQPVATTSAADRPSPPTQPSTRRAEVAPARPSPPKWITTYDVDDPDADAVLDARAEASRRLRIDSRNVRLFRIDLRELRDPASPRGSWNLTLDRQPFELTGRRGQVITFARSQTGRWDIIDAQ